MEIARAVLEQVHARQRNTQHRHQVNVAWLEDILNITNYSTKERYYLLPSDRLSEKQAEADALKGGNYSNLCLVCHWQDVANARTHTHTHTGHAAQVG